MGTERLERRKRAIVLSTERRPHGLKLFVSDDVREKMGENGDGRSLSLMGRQESWTIL